MTDTPDMPTEETINGQHLWEDRNVNNVIWWQCVYCARTAIDQVAQVKLNDEGCPVQVVMFE